MGVFSPWVQWKNYFCNANKEVSLFSCKRQRIAVYLAQNHMFVVLLPECYRKENCYCCFKTNLLPSPTQLRRQSLKSLALKSGEKANSFILLESYTPSQIIVFSYPMRGAAAAQLQFPSVRFISCGGKYYLHETSCEWACFEKVMVHLCLKQV